MLSALILILSCSTTDLKLVRLVDKSGDCSGKPEIFYNGQWHRVHSSNFDFKDAMVVCRELNCGNAITVGDALELKKEDTRVDVRCDGQEASVMECRCDEVSAHRGGGGCGRAGLYSHNTELICSEPVKLVDGPGFCSGRLEVKSGDSWTTVCDTDFDWQDAKVVCRELGCGSPLSLQGALFDKEKQMFGTEEFLCSGAENYLFNCSTSAREDQNCTLGRAVNLTCSGPEDVRMIGIGRCAGTVQMQFSGEWKAVAADHWTWKEAVVACRQLGCGPAVAATQFQQGGDLHGWGFGVKCVGTEEALRECRVKTVAFVKILAGVVCTDLLVQPSISFSAPINPSRGLQGPEVFRGHSFTITCSTQSQYPGGSFHLTLSWTNQSYTQAAVKHSPSLNNSVQGDPFTSPSPGPDPTSRQLSITQPDVNHSASFLFPAADYSHLGQYHCVYENELIIECRRFSTGGEWVFGALKHNCSSAKSDSLSLIITDSPVPAAISRMVIVPFLLLITCLFIFLIYKKRKRFLMRNTSGHQRAAEKTMPESVELVSLSSSSGKDRERGPGKELRTDERK